MPVIPIRSGVQQGGIVWDAPANELPANLWSAGANCRLFKNTIERIGGPKRLETYTNGRALWATKIYGVPGLLRVSATLVELSSDGENWSDVTPLAGMVDADDWILNQWGDWLLLTSSGTAPLVKDPQAAAFVAFANWPVGYLAHKLFGYKDFIIALGTEIGGDPQNALAKWSDTVDPSDISNVEWDHTDPTNLAGERVLPTGGGVIRDGGRLRDSVILYLDREVWKMDFTTTEVNGVAVVFDFAELFADDGILAERCWEEIEGYHYVVGRTDIYKHDGFNRVSISDNRATEFFRGQQGDTNFVFAHHVPEKQELQVFYAEKQNQFASNALLYSYLYDAWSSIDISDLDGGDGGMVSHVALGPAFGATPIVYDDVLNPATDTYEDYKFTTYADLFKNTRDLDTYALAPNLLTGGIYLLDQSPDNADFIPTLLLERTDLDLDEFFETTRFLKYVTRMYPLAVGTTGTIQVQFGGRNDLASAVVWEDAIDFEPGDYKVDTRITYRYPAIRVFQPGLSVVSFTGYDLEVYATHGR